MSIKTWFAENLDPRRWKTRTRVLVASATALVLVGGIGAAVALRQTAPEPVRTTTAPKPTATASATPTPTPTPAAVPRTAVGIGAIAAWRTADRTQLAGVLPQVGDAAEGQIALSIDAPVVPEPRSALSTTVEVRPSTEYAFTGFFRLPEAEPTEAPATLRIGADSMTLPDLNADWREIEFSYETGPQETSVDITLLVDDVVRGLDVDDLAFVAAGGENILPNPSFEEVTADWGIRNDNLILQQQTAALAVSMASGEASWVAKRLDGQQVAAGTAPVAGPLSVIPLDGLPQGYYDLTVTDAAGRSVSAPVGLIDMATAHVPTDTRIGAHIHAQKDFNAEATIAAGGLGMGLLRVGDNWQLTEPSAGSYAFSENLSRALQEAEAIGMDKLMVAGRTNRAYDGGMPPSSAAALDAYGRYAAALAQNFDLDALEVFNEFNIRSFNKGLCDGHASCYAPILASAHDAVEAVAPELPVIGGATGNFDAAWFDELWRNGGLDDLDAMSFHPYQVYGQPEALAGVVNDARAGMDAHGGAKPIWITELGWTTKTGDVSFEQQANMLVRAELTALASGVDRYIWYDLVNDENDRAAHEGNFGQFWQRRDGVAAFPPKPAAFTQALLLSTLAGKEYAGADDVGIEGARSLIFEDADQTVRYVWMRTGEGTAQYNAEGPITVTSSDGTMQVVNPRDGKVTVTLTTTPAILTGEFDD
jgi:hypothetical protein